MPASSLIFVRDDSERKFRLKLDDKDLGRFTYDELGWSGLESVENLAKAFAKEFDLEIKEEYE